MQLRKVDPFDDDEAADDIRWLDGVCFVGTAAPVELEDATWWIGYDDGKPIAYCGVKDSATLLGWGYMCRAGVHPQHRGNGYQQRLIRKRIRYARENAMRGLRTDTSYDNVASSNSLIKCGFKLFIPRHKWAFRQSLYWRLDL